MSTDQEAIRGGSTGIVEMSRRIVDAAKTIIAADDARSLAQRTATLAFSIRVVSAAVAYAMQVLLARWMGGFEYGVFVFVWVWVLIGGTMAGIGLNTAVLRFVPEYDETKKLDYLRGFLFSSRWIGLVVASAFAALGAAGIYLFGDWIENYYVLPLYLILICFPFVTLNEMQDGIARSYNWIAVALVPPFLIRPLLILLFMAGAIALGFAPTAATAALAAIGGSWLSAIVQFAVLQKRLAKKIPSGPRQYDFSLWLRVSFPLVLVESFYVILGHTDILVLGGFVEPAQIAIYFAVMRTIGLVSFVSFAVTAAVTHRFSQLNAAGDQDGLAVCVRDAVNWTFWPSLAAALFILALGYPLLYLFGPGFTAGYPLMFVLAIGILIRASIGPVESLLNMLGHQVACAQILIATVAFNLMANFALIPFFGLLGAAMATSISVIVESVLLFVMTGRLTGMKIFVWKKTTGMDAGNGQ
ncbi:MAG: polysaccharide biosynthesis C-terminal domain-containing protein [Fimbriimonadaceae bacterium]|nr:polysaccharide biosynthesis C-terminal domain-containing protein [Alphaproteobacteria bacterium]